MDEISSWGLHSCIVKNYQENGIQKLFNWQVECLNSPGVLDGKNLVFSAPTSAGKTLIVEILLIKRLQKTGNKVIFILPYVSLVKEKMFSLQQLVEGSGIRVDGYMGGISPSGGFSSIDVAICTIEKANSLINRLIEEKKLHKLGMIVVDELHMVSDQSRGYLLELLLTKVRFLSLCKTASSTQEYNLQIIGMSATVPNLNLLSDWLDATLYQTTFRPVPLQRCIKIGLEIFDENFTKLRNVQSKVELFDDQNEITSLCHETILDGNSVLIFCPTKQWCEKLSNLIARNFYYLNSNSDNLQHHIKLKTKELEQIVEHLKRLPSGLDDALKLTIPLGVAYHHAGLTTEERDVIEGGFRRNFIKVLVATSTLSSGVNLPARRVIIRTPIFHRNVINLLTYQQMAGRAGRKGKDQSGESILICQPSERKKVEVLLKNGLPPIQSCLNSISNNTVTKSMKRAILEIIVNGIASTFSDILLYIKCTLLSAQLKCEADLDADDKNIDIEIIKECLLWLKEYEFIYMESNLEDESENKDILNTKLSASQFGRAALLSSLPASEALQVLADLRMASKNLVLDTELHLVYQITPLYSFNDWQNLNWIDYLRIYEGLPGSLLRVADIVGINEGFITRLATCGSSLLSGKITEKRLRQLNIHTRFFAALALHDLVNEVPLNITCEKFNCNRGMLQSLQQSASSFAGMVTTFCQQLGWWSLELLFKEFQCRLVFGVQHQLVDLTKISIMKKEYARALYNAGYTTCELLACAETNDISTILRNSTKFQSIRKDVLKDNLPDTDEVKPNNIILFGSNICLTEEEAAAKFIKQAQILHPLERQDDTSITQPILPTTLNHDSTFSSQDFLQKLSQKVPPEKFVYNNENNDKSDNEINNENKELNYSLISKNSITNESDKDFLFSFQSQVQSINIHDETFEFTFNDSKQENCKTANINSLSLNSIQDKIEKELHNKDDEETKSKTAMPEGLTKQSEIYPQVSNVVLINDTIESEYNTSMTDSQIVTMFKSGLTQTENKSNLEFSLTKQKLGKGELKDYICCVKPENLMQQKFSTPTEMQNLQANNLEKKYMSSPCPNIDPFSSLCSTPILDNLPSQLQDNKPTSDNSGDMLLINNDQEFVNLSELFSHSVSLVDKFDNTSCDLFHSNSTETVVENKQNLPFDDMTNLENSINKITLNEKSTIIPQNKKQLNKLELLYKKSDVIIDVCANIELFYCFIQELSKQKVVGIAVISEIMNKIKEENCYKHKMNMEVEGISVCWNQKNCYYISLQNDKNCPIPVETRISEISKIMNSNKDCVYVGSNVKQQVKLISSLFDIYLHTKWKDPLIAAWLLDPDNLDIKFDDLMKKHATNYKKIIHGIKNSRMSNPIKLACKETLLSFDSVFQMDEILSEQKMLKSYQDIEMPHVVSLAILEMNGIGIDIVKLKRHQTLLLKYLRELQNEAWKIMGHKFNLSSTTEVAKVLYGELGLKPSSETLKSLDQKKSHYKYWGTNKIILTELSEQINPHPLPIVIMQWRSLHYSLYKVLHPLSSQLNLDSDDIQFFTPSCVACTSTGRISMCEPNIQNIPKLFSVNLPNTSLNKTGEISSHEINLRSLFVSNTGNVFISADYSQLELRILAHMSKDDKLLSTLNRSDGVDVFKLIAVSLNEKINNPEQVNNDRRQMAKQICYGIIYGMGANSLSKQMKKSETEAANFIESFMKMYSKVSVYLQKTVKSCKENGYITTLAGRRRYLPDIRSPRMELRGHAERQAINSVIQGSAADLVKSATCEIIKEAAARKWNLLRHKENSDLLRRNCYFVHQIHDELIFEVNQSMVNEVCLVMHHCMTTCVSLNVKLSANFKVGPAWGNLETYEFSFL